MSDSSKKRAWWWVPSLYYAEGLPYVVVMIVSVIMYKRLGISNTEIALYTSWLYLPWVIKPLWSPLVDLVRTKRFWIVTMQLLVGAGLAGVALTLPTSDFFRYSMAFLWLLAFSSATHDIAADGFYMLGLSQHDQAWFVGIRSTFYRLAMITGQGLLVILAGYLETATGYEPASLDVRVVEEAMNAPLVAPDSIRWSGAPQGRLAFGTASVVFGLTGADNDRVDSLVTLARQWNTVHGFVAAPVAASEHDGDTEPGWWTSSVSGPLARQLKYWFGEETPPAPEQAAGQVALVPVFAPASDESSVVNLSRESGDPSVRIIEGERLVFGPGNGDRPGMVVIEVDGRVRSATDARFVARSGNIPLAWSITFFVLAGLFVVFFVYHRIALPRPTEDQRRTNESASEVLKAFFETFVSFFRKPHIVTVLAFFLLYRFAEAQLVKLASPFLLDARELGGLALSTGEVGFAYGTVGILALTAGGLLGGFLAARNGLKYWIWWMVIAINLPNAVYIYLSYAMPESLWIVNAAVAVEQFGYGFGFTAYMLYMIYVADGPQKTAHFAICTGFMALGMMLPGMFSGWLQEIIGYRHFFVWVLLATIPAFLVSGLVPLDRNFGRQESGAAREE